MTVLGDAMGGLLGCVGCGAGLLALRRARITERETQRFYDEALAKAQQADERYAAAIRMIQQHEARLSEWTR